MAAYYVGWDVGAWYCNTSSSSCDALVVLGTDAENIAVRKNVKEALEKNTIFEFMDFFFPKKFNKEDNFIFAIDAVFAFPKGIIDLLSGKNPTFDFWGKSIENPLLFRYTEHFVMKNKKKNPLSVIQDRIGSQSTKVIYFLNHFGFRQEEATGVWKSDGNIAIETYPSVLGKKGTDVSDAELCAYLAWAFDKDKTKLYCPPEDNKVKDSVKAEGWIWFYTKDPSDPSDPSDQ